MDCLQITLHSWPGAAAAARTIFAGLVPGRLSAAAHVRRDTLGFDGDVQPGEHNERRCRPATRLPEPVPTVVPHSDRTGGSWSPNSPTTSCTPASGGASLCPTGWPGSAVTIAGRAGWRRGRPGGAPVEGLRGGVSTITMPGDNVSGGRDALTDAKPVGRGQKLAVAKGDTSGQRVYAYF